MLKYLLMTYHVRNVNSVNK